MGEWDAHSLQDVGVGLLITLPVTVAYASLWKHIGRKFGLDFWNAGSLVYINYASIFCVFLFLIPVGLAAWLTSGLALEPYMRQQWLEGEDRRSQWLEVLWIFGFCVHMNKDFICGVRALIALHHVVCLVTSLAFLFVGPPGLLVMGAAILEIGSGMSSIAQLMQDSMPVARLNVAVMTLTNSFGLWAAYLMFTAVGAPAALQWFFPIVLVVLIWMRQLQIHKMYAGTLSRQGGGAAEGAAAGAKMNKTKGA